MPKRSRTEDTPCEAAVGRVEGDTIAAPAGGQDPPAMNRRVCAACDASTGLLVELSAGAVGASGVHPPGQ